MTQFKFKTRVWRFLQDSFSPLGEKVSEAAPLRGRMRGFKKVTAFLVLWTFGLGQLGLGQEVPLPSTGSLQPVKTINTDSDIVGTVPSESDGAVSGNTDDFLVHTLTLTPAEETPALLTELLKAKGGVELNIKMPSNIFGVDTAKLRSAQWSEGGALSEGILEFPDGHAVQIKRGQIHQILNPSGELEGFDESGNLEWIVGANGSKSIFTYSLDSNGVKQGVTVTSGDTTAVYDSAGRLQTMQNSNQHAVYEGGILKQLGYSSGESFDYAVSVDESRLLGTAPENFTDLPVLMRYSAAVPAGGGADKQMTYLETRDGRKFEFANGLLTRALNAGGQETNYDFSSSVLGEITGYTATRAGLKRIYDEKGNLSQFISSHGLKAEVQAGQIQKVDLGDGRFLTDIVFDAQNNMSDGKVHEASGVVSRYLNNAIVEAWYPDGTHTQFEGGKATFMDMPDGRKYQYVYTTDVSGQETSKAQLISYTSASGNILRVAGGVVQDFELHSANAFDQMAGSVAALASSDFIPLLRTPGQLIRNLKLDANGHLEDAEILLPSGDQYFIVQGKLDHVISLEGKTYRFAGQQAVLRLSSVESAANGTTTFEYTPGGVTAHYTVDGIARSTDLLTYFQSAGHADEINYLLGAQPVDLFSRSLEQGSIYTPGQGHGLESRIKDDTDGNLGFVTAFDYQVVPDGGPVGYYTKLAKPEDFSNADFLSFTIRRDGGLDVLKSVEVKLEGMGQSFIVNDIPEGWKRVVLPLKKPNADLKQLAILIHDSLGPDGGPSSGRLYIGDITPFSIKNYGAGSWESAVGITAAGIEDLARRYLQNGNPVSLTREHTLLSGLEISDAGVIEKAKVESKNGALVFFDQGEVTKVITPDGKTVLYNQGLAQTVLASDNQTAAFSYTHDLKGNIDTLTVSGQGISRVYDPQGDLKRVIFQGLSGSLDQGVLDSLRTRYETVTSLVGDEFGHIRSAVIHLSDGRVLEVKDYKLSKMTLASATVVSYTGDGLAQSIQTKDTLSEYVYDKGVDGKILGVHVRYSINGGVSTESNLISFLKAGNRIEEAAILLDSPLRDVIDISSNIGSFFTPDQGYVVEHKVTDAERGSVYSADYTIPENATYMGLYFRFPNLDLSKYELMNVSLKGVDSAGGAAPSVTLELKGEGNERITLDQLSNTWSDTEVALTGAASDLYEITLLVNPDRPGSGKISVDNISFFNLRKIGGTSWEQELSFNDKDLESFSHEITKAPLVDPLLYKVEMPVFPELVNFKGFPTTLDFNGDGKVSAFLRGDGASFSVANGTSVTGAQLADGRSITYAKNGDGSIFAKIEPSPFSPSTIDYSYGRMRNVTLEDGKQLEYHYEFDEVGNEITVVRDPATGEVRKFRDEKIQSAEDQGGLITTYQTGASGIEQSTLSYKGKATLEITKYEQKGDHTFITDSGGITWIYDSNGVLVQHLTAEGFLYQHTTVTDSKGELQRVIYLAERKAPDGSQIFYDQGEVSRLVLANGVSFVNPQYDADHQLNGGTVMYEDGSRVEYQNDFATSVKGLSGSSRTFQVPDGKMSLETGTEGQQSSPRRGQVEFVRVDKQDGSAAVVADGTQLRYNRQGDLVNLMTPEGVFYRYASSKIYRRELAKVAGVSVPFPVAVETNGFGDTRVFINHELVRQSKNKVEFIAIDPMTGQIDGAAVFDMSQPGKGQDILDFVTAIPGGEYVLAIFPKTVMNYGDDSPNFFTALDLIGANQQRDFFKDWSQPWIVLGQKNILPNQAYGDFKSYAFNNGTIRLETEKEQVFKMDGTLPPIPASLIGTSRHGAFITEVTETFGTVTDGVDLFAGSYFKNYNTGYPESGFYRFLPDFEKRDFIERPAEELDRELSGMVDFADRFDDRAVYFDDRYPVNGIPINQLRSVKGYLVSKGFQVLNADELARWMQDKGPGALVYMLQDIAPDTIVDVSSEAATLPRAYLDRGGSIAWFYDVPFYQIGHANGAAELWGPAGDHYGERKILGISTAYEPARSTPMAFSVPALSPPAEALSQPLHLDFDIHELDAWQSIRNSFNAALPPASADIASIFDKDGTVLGVLKGDGMRNVFEQGHVRTLLDRDGRHVVDYFFNQGELIAANYVQARENLRSEIENAELEVARLKTKALIQLAVNLNLGVTDIQNEIQAQRLRLADARAQAEAQRFITQCQSCGMCSQCCEQVKNPGYEAAIANITDAEQELEIQAAASLSQVHGEVSDAQVKIGLDQAASIAKIRQKEKEVLRNLIENEILPVLMEFYRGILGRDPGTPEINRWLDQAVADPQNRVNVESLKAELQASSERTQRLSDIAWIKNEVKTFLDAYTTAGPEEQVSRAASLGLVGSEIVPVSASERDAIMATLNNQNVHFGYSAFLPLQSFLAGVGVTAEAKEIAVRAILIDILTGVLNPFTEGELRLSLFALERTAHLYGISPKAAKLSYQDLLSIYAANPGVKVVAHIKGDHYVTITKVTSDSVTYVESAMGQNGEAVELSRDQFLAAWLNPQTGKNMGVALLPEIIPVKPAQMLDKQLMQFVKGSMCGIDDALFWTIVIVSAVVSGTVQAITATNGNFVTNFLKGFAFGAITSIVTIGIGSALSSFASAVGNVVSNVVNGIKSFVSPIVNGLVRVASSVGRFILDRVITPIGNFLTQTPGLIGKGLSSIGGFLSDAGKAVITGFKTLGQLVTAQGLQGTIARIVIAPAVEFSVNKGLRILGVSPKIAMLASAFVTGGLLGALTPSPDITVGGIRVDGTSIFATVPANVGKTAIDGFVRGAFSGMTLAAVPVATQSFHLSPAISNLLSTASKLLLSAGGSLNNNTLQGLSNTLAGEFAITGFQALGTKIGLSPALNSLIGIPLRSTLAGLIDGLSNPNGGGPGSILNAIKESLLNNQTAGSFISIGANLALDAVGAPLIARDFVSSFLGTIVSNGPDILSKIGEGIRKFGEAVVNAAGNVISFAQKVVEGVGSLTKGGFSKAVDFFNGIFDSKTQGTLIQAGGGTIENALNNNCSVIVDGIHCGYQSIVINYSLSNNRLSYSNAGTNASFDGLNKVGEFFSGSIAFANEVAPDGIKLIQNYGQNGLRNVSMYDGLNKLLEMNPFSEHQPLTFANSTLTDGVLSVYGNNPVQISMRNGVVDKYTALVSQNSYPNANNAETFENIFVDLTRDSSGNYLRNVRIENPFVDNITGVAGLRDRTLQLANIFFGRGINNPNGRDISTAYENKFVQEFAQRGITLEAIPVFDGTNIITGVYHVAKEMYFTDPLNKDKIKEVILNRIQQQPLAPGEKLKLVLYSGSGQPGLEAAQELGYQYGIQFSDVVLLDAPVFINSSLSNIDHVHLIQGDLLNFPPEKAIPLGWLTPFILPRSEGGMQFMNILGALKVRRSTMTGFGHLDFISEENISSVVNRIIKILSDEEGD